MSTGIHGDGLDSLQFRRTPGGLTEQVIAPITHADVVQLERQGNTYIMSVARFGDPFTSVQVRSLTWATKSMWGYRSAHRRCGDAQERAIFRNVRIVEPVKPGFVRMRDPLGSHLELLDIESGQRQIVQLARHLQSANWTVDGKALIYNSGGLLYRFDLMEKTSTIIDTGPITQNSNDHVLSFDGTMLAISSRSAEDNVSIVYTVPTGGKRNGSRRKALPICTAGRRMGKFLVYTGLRNGDFDIYRISADGGRRNPTYDRPRARRWAGIHA